MADFAQTGLISTLQRLNDSHLGAIEEELVELAREKPIAVILPCHGRDLDRPALAHILGEIRGAKWIDEVVASLNGLDADALARAETLFAELPQRKRILWNDAGEPPSRSGKGFNVWKAFQAIASEGRAAVIATQDCDVASFRRADLARLCYAVAQPALGYRFAKMYYSRVTDRLYGRVSRLFLAPLLQAVVRVAGHLPLVDFLLSFRYPLAGEAATTRELAAELPLQTGWGLEISQLCEIFRRVDPRDVAQVDGGTGYDHKHQPADTALAVMTAEIARELFTQLTLEGLAPNDSFREAIARAYRQEAIHALRRSAHLARMNALPFDEKAEQEIVVAFAARLDALIRLV
jgi:glucosyl-3-phosphoglycerate synthase